MAEIPQEVIEEFAAALESESGEYAEELERLLGGQINGGADQFENRLELPICIYCKNTLYHLPGEHDQCDHSVTGECVEEEPKGERAELFKAEREIVRKDVEHGAAFDAIGKRIGTWEGTAKSISISAASILLMRNDGNAVLTHNHPTQGGGGSLSMPDLQFASSANLAEIRAVNETRYGKFTYVAKRPRTGWPSSEVIQEAWIKHVPAVWNIISVRYGSGRIERLAANLAASHAMTNLVTRDLGIEYRQIRVRRPRKA